MKTFFLMCILSATSVQAATHYFVRHAEKDNSSVMNKNPDLSLKGQQRAQNLALLLSQANIKHIYSTAYKRTEQTAQPLADILNITVTHYDPSNMSELIELLKSKSENALIVGHSNTTTEAISLLTGKSMNGMTEDDYGDVFQVINNDESTWLNHLKSAPANKHIKTAQPIKTK